jgi:hypothetical protein
MVARKLKLLTGGQAYPNAVLDPGRQSKGLLPLTTQGSVPGLDGKLSEFCHRPTPSGGEVVDFT